VIELRTKIEDCAPEDCDNKFVHDALAAHAWDMAHREWWLKDHMEQFPEEVTPRSAVKWIEQRASEIHARLMKGETI